MAAHSVAIPAFQSKTTAGSSRQPKTNLPAGICAALMDIRNSINERINAAVGLADTQGRLRHPEFSTMQDIHRVLEGNSELTANILLIAGFVLADQTYEATSVDFTGPMTTDNGYALLEGDMDGRTVRYQVPFEATYMFGTPKPLKGRFQKFN